MHARIHFGLKAIYAVKRPRRLIVSFICTGYKAAYALAFQSPPQHSYTLTHWSKRHMNAIEYTWGMRIAIWEGRLSPKIPRCSASDPHSEATFVRHPLKIEPHVSLISAHLSSKSFSTEATKACDVANEARSPTCPHTQYLVMHY